MKYLVIFNEAPFYGSIKAIPDLNTLQKTAVNNLPVNIDSVQIAFKTEEDCMECLRDFTWADHVNLFKSPMGLVLLSEAQRYQELVERFLDKHNLIIIN
tara:strand:- start:91 stop:387 length:297 start_codon:yes stop_codon:yes gene_type:complete